MVPVMLELWGMLSSPSLPSLTCPLWRRVVAPVRALSMGQIELNSILMLYWTVWNKTVLTFKLRTYTKLNWLKWNCFWALDWIVWNGTVFFYFELYLYLTESLEIELFCYLDCVLVLDWIVWSGIFDIESSYLC